MAKLTRIRTARQFEHIAVIRHGVATGPSRVEFDAPIAAGVAGANDIVQGSVVSLNADGKYVLGCAAGSVANRPVPCISLKNAFDPDVTTGIVKSADATSHQDVFSGVGGSITAIPCTCGYELQTTQFVADTYAVNDGITAGTVGNLGKVAKATVAPGKTEPYLGFVSVPPAKDYLGNQRIAFFTNFIPAGIAEA